MKKYDIKRIIITTLAILLIPIFLSIYSIEVNWGYFDFIFAGAIILLTLTVGTIARRKIGSKNKKIAAIIATILIFLIIWIELSVGIF